MPYDPEAKEEAKDYDDDNATITLSSRDPHADLAEAKQGGVPGRQLQQLDLIAVAKNERDTSRPREDYERVEQALDRQVLVIFRLPDGSEGEKFFKMGHTVEVLKSYIQEEFDIPMPSWRRTLSELFLEDQLMLNPLTLSDFPEIRPPHEVFLRVEGTLPESASKK